MGSDDDFSDEEAEMRALRQNRGYSSSLASKRTVASASGVENIGSMTSDARKQPVKRAVDHEIVEDIDAPMDMAAIMGFGGFGKKSSSQVIKKEQAPIISPKSRIKQRPMGEETDVGLSAPTEESEPIEDEQERDSDSNSDDDVTPDDQYRIPIAQHVTMKHGSKTVSSVSIDPSGARLVTGSYDYDVKMWDFNGMNHNMRSFRDLEPMGNHQIKTVAYSSTGDRVLVVAANAQAKVLTRDGIEILECVKGDPYIVDMVNTKGHTGMLYGGCWHPRDKDGFMTWGLDGTIRLWNTESPNQQKQVIKVRTNQGRRTQATCAAFTHDGSMIAGGTEAGGIFLWSPKGPFVSPKMSQHKAHSIGSGPTSVCFAMNNQLLLSRGLDDTLKLWDVRKFSQPVHVASGLENAVQETGCLFSPNDKLVVTGTSVRKGEGYGKIVMLDTATFQLVYEAPVTQASVVSLAWHPKLNQIVAGAADGTIQMYYDPKLSVKGALLCASKVVKRKFDGYASVDLTHQHILTPHALPLFADAPKTKARRKEKDRKDPIKSRQPELPFDAKEGIAGRIAPNWTQWIKDEIEKDTTRDEDPREAILRHAAAAAANPMFIAPAYSETQPNEQLAQPEDSEEEEEN